MLFADTEQSNHTATFVGEQKRFLAELGTRLEASPSAVVEDLEALRLALSKPSLLTLNVACDVTRVSSLIDSLSRYFPATPDAAPKLTVSLSRDLLPKDWISAKVGTEVLGLSAVESGL